MSISRQDFALQFFNYAHLPEELQAVSKPFHALAHQLVDSIGESAERRACLRKLLEAKDCAVRAHLLHSERSKTDNDLPIDNK